ncbi:MAG: hypothetical protein ACI4AA_07175 [Lachnospiraceae bacterium]
MKKLKEIMLWGFKQMIIILAASIVYMLTFHLSILNITGIYFYDGILRLLLVLILMIVAFILLRKHIFHDYKDICFSIVSFALVNMLWFSLCVVSMDRSLSVYILCCLEQTEASVDEDEFKVYCKDVFTEQYGMIERRYNEQIASHNIVIDKNGEILITDSGKLMVHIFKFISFLYQTDDRFTYPEPYHAIE